eukprot:1984264-Prymnesium_polylepis.1
MPPHRMCSRQRMSVSGCPCPCPCPDIHVDISGSVRIHPFETAWTCLDVSRHVCVNTHTLPVSTPLLPQDFCLNVKTHTLLGERAVVRCGRGARRGACACRPWRYNASPTRPTDAHPSSGSPNTNS